MWSQCLQNLTSHSSPEKVKAEMPELHVTQFHQTYHNCKHHQSLSLITHNLCWDTSFSFGGAVSALDHVLQPSQSQRPFTPWTVGSPQASGRRILCIWAASCRVQGLMNSSCWYWPLSEHHLVASQSLFPVLHTWETQPSFDILETFPGG